MCYVFKKDYGSLTEDSKKTYYEVALATAAAPTYLPVRTINDNEYIDGTFHKIAQNYFHFEIY